MKCSVVMATKNKSQYLRRTLDSILCQTPPFEFEVIVVDDGATDCTPKVCDREGVTYVRLENPLYRNPSIARNVGYRLAKGEVIIAQSDEVTHETPDAIELLCTELQEQEFLIATVYNYCVATGKRIQLYTGNGRKRPFFFLGSLWRKDLYAIGGNDEEFTEPGYDDDWFGVCLIQGLGLAPRFLDKVVGHHQDHHRPQGLSSRIHASKQRYVAKMQSGIFISSGGAWK